MNRKAANSLKDIRQELIRMNIAIWQQSSLCKRHTDQRGGPKKTHQEMGSCDWTADDNEKRQPERKLDPAQDHGKSPLTPEGILHFRCVRCSILLGHHFNCLVLDRLSSALNARRIVQ